MQSNGHGGRLVRAFSVAALLVLGLALAPRAGAFIYWTDGGTIGRSNLDGTGIDERFISGTNSVGSVAVDAQYIYWTGSTEDQNSTIVRAKLDGTKVDQTFVPFLAGPQIGAIAVDDDHIYWAENHPSHPPGTTPPSGSIGRANLDGTGVDENFIAGPANIAVLDVVVDKNHIYWAESSVSLPPQTSPPVGSIGRANLDGTGVDESFITGDFGLPGDLAVDAGHLYWTNALTGAIGRANLDATGVDQSFITSASAHGGLAVNFSLGRLKKDKKKGTAKLTVEVPAPGGIALAQTKKLRGAELRAEAAGEVQLAIKPRGRAKKRLAEKGKAKVKADVTYTPDGGEPNTQIAALKLIERG
jgi:sugar lactone lactonase YvrE